MSVLGLQNTKLAAGQQVQRLGLSTRSHKVAPSVAEQAIFIPKPHKRVEFKLNTGDAAGGGNTTTQAAPLPGSGKSESIPLPGSDKQGQANVADSMTAGQLGDHGVTASMGKSEWSGGGGAPRVEMQVISDPTKASGITDPIPTQEEGRQVNHKEVNFTQQYDAYGRPRIGFSREPYDFAATKFVSVTSQVAFQQNMAEVHQQYDQYLLTSQSADPAAQMTEQKANNTPSDGAGGSGTAGNGNQVSVTGGDNAGSEASSAVMGQEKAEEQASPSVMGQEKATEQSSPKVIGQEKIDDLSKPQVLGDTGGEQAEAQVINSGSGGTGETGEKKSVSAEEAFEKQKSGGAANSGETESGKGLGEGGGSGKASSAYQQANGDQSSRKLSLSV